MTTRPKGMYLSEYQEAAKRTLQPPRDDLPIELYLALKLQQEASEAQQAITKRVFHKYPLNLTQLMLELGDVLWYLTMLADHYGWDLSDVAVANINKLRERHGEQYNAAHYTGTTPYNYQPDDDIQDAL